MGAPLNPVPTTLRVFAEGFVSPGTPYLWGNVLHFEYTGTAPSNATCATIAGQLATQWGTHMSPEQISTTTLTAVTVTDLTSTSAGEGSVAVSVPGTRGDDELPANAALLVSYPSATRYKGGHPRTYLIGGGFADLVSAAQWTTAFQAEVQTHWQALLTAMVGYTTGGTTLSSFGFVRYHGKYLPNGGAPHFYLDTPFYTPIVIADATVAQEIASQKRRIGRRKA